MSIETIDFQIALIPLFSGTLNIRHLNASDVDIKSYGVEEEIAAPGEKRRLDLLPVVELAELRSVRYTREQFGDMPAVDVFLDRMRLMESSPDGKRVLEGAGRIGTDEAAKSLAAAMKKLIKFWSYSFRSGEHGWLMGCGEAPMDCTDLETSRRS